MWREMRAVLIRRRDQALFKNYVPEGEAFIDCKLTTGDECCQARIFTLLKSRVATVIQSCGHGNRNPADRRLACSVSELSMGTVSLRLMQFTGKWAIFAPGAHCNRSACIKPFLHILRLRLESEIYGIISA